MQIKRETFGFLEELKKNNDRKWFANNKLIYQKCLANAKDVFSEIFQNLEKYDTIERQKIFRIYRDVRFSKDKSPYKPRFATEFKRQGQERRCDYFLNIEPGDSFIAGGYWMPDKDDLFRVRKEIELDDSEFREILASDDFVKYFGGRLEGEELKTAPRDFDKNHKAIDLLRKKGYLVIRRFSDDEVLSESFIHEVDKTFIALRPLFDLVSDILSTNLNGELIA